VAQPAREQHEHDRGADEQQAENTTGDREDAHPPHAPARLGHHRLILVLGVRFQALQALIRTVAHPAPIERLNDLVDGACVLIPEGGGADRRRPAGRLREHRDEIIDRPKPIAREREDLGQSGALTARTRGRCRGGFSTSVDRGAVV
jgi:hypothetical protein